MTNDQRPVAARGSDLLRARTLPRARLARTAGKSKNTLRHLMGETLITHLGLDYYED